MKKVLLVAAAVAVLAWPVAAQQTFSPDAEGFIRNWLVLAPIPMAGQSGAEEIDVERQWWSLPWSRRSSSRSSSA